MRCIGVAIALVASTLSAQAQIKYWTGMGNHYFRGACCYCLEAQRHEVRKGLHFFLVDGKWKPVAQSKVRLTPDPKGKKIYYCSGSMDLQKGIPSDRCGLVRGSG